MKTTRTPSCPRASAGARTHTVPSWAAPAGGAGGRAPELRHGAAHGLLQEQQRDEAAEQLAAEAREPAALGRQRWGRRSSVPRLTVCARLPGLGRSVLRPQGDLPGRAAERLPQSHAPCMPRNISHLRAAGRQRTGRCSGRRRPAPGRPGRAPSTGRPRSPRAGSAAAPGPAGLSAGALPLTASALPPTANHGEGMVVVWCGAVWKVWLACKQRDRAPGA
jgi:hypothetical protein